VHIVDQAVYDTGTDSEHANLLSTCGQIRLSSYGNRAPNVNVTLVTPV
jgi:hypothetical protein